MRIRETSNWKENYDDGREFYNEKQYENALSSYHAALISTNPPPPESEKPILLSNSVACRLQIGGNDQLEAALAEALECVSLNPRWAKGHVRLGSVYISLKQSNDACNSLQRAISLDPSNQNARSMLIRELRRDSIHQNQSNKSNNQTGNNPYTNASAPPFQSSNTSNGSTDSTNANASSNSNSSNTSTNINGQSNIYNDIDDLPSFTERLSQKFFFYVDRVKHFYTHSNEDTKSFLKALLIIVCLYIGFGGRFGLDYITTGGGRSSTTNSYNYRYEGSTRNSRVNDRSSSSQQTYSTSYSGPSRGNYGRGNAYDQFHDNQNFYSSSHSSPSYSYHFPNPLDGGIFSIILLFGAVYIAKYFGGVDINPWHALWVMRMLGNRGRVGGYRAMGGRRFGGRRGYRGF